MRKLSILSLIVFFAGSGLAAVEIGPGLRIFQFEQGSNVNFSQSQNLSQLGVRSQLTDFGTSNFSVEPESSASAELDFYRPFADRQDFLTNFTARSSPRQEVNFSLSNLPSDDFYEAFFSRNDTRVFIGFTDQLSRFNFSTTLLNANLSVFNYGEKGVAIDNITFNDSEPVEGEILGIEEEIFNEGVVDDEAVNKTLTISTYNGSGWQQKQFRSEDLAVPIENTETRLSFTAKFEGSFTNTTQYRNGGGQLGLGYQNGTSGDNLVGYLRMDQAESGAGGTVEDFSGEGNDGTYRNGVNTASEGILGTGAAGLDGSDDWIEANSMVPEIAGGDFSATAWFKTIEDERGIIFALNQNDGSNRILVYNDVLFDNVDSTNRDYAGNFKDGEWHFLAFTHDESQGENVVYIDGTQQASTPVSDTVASDDKLNLGQEFDSSVASAYHNGSIDEFRLYDQKLTQQKLDNLYLQGVPFQGNYTTEEIQEGELTHWYRVNLDANIPDQTELDAEFRALDSNGNVVDTDGFNVEGGDNYYNVSVQDSYGAELYLNGSSENLTKSWEVNQLQVISGGPYIDPWEVKPGPFRFNVSLDPNDEVKETNETNNNASEILNVDSYQVFYGGSDLSKEVGAESDDMYVWNPENSQGFLYFADVDSEFDFKDLKPVNGSSFPKVDEVLNMLGHNDSIQNVWDPNGDGLSDQIADWSIAGTEMDVPVADSTSAGTFRTGILFDSSASDSFTGSEDLVFATKLRPGTLGKFGRYDYEARIPFGLRSLKPGSDRVQIYDEVK